MTFEKTPRGTHGWRLPPGGTTLVRLLNPVLVGRALRKSHLVGIDVLVLSTTGAKTGRRRQTVLGYVPDGEGCWLILATAGGVAYHPTWYHNLAARPDQLEISLGGEKIAVTASQLSGAEREAAWQRAAAAIPRYARFAAKTDRQIPVIRLTRA